MVRSTSHDIFELCQPPLARVRRICSTSETICSPAYHARLPRNLYRSWPALEGRMMILRTCSSSTCPPAAVAAQAALASLSKITLSASEPPSTATTSEISDDISELGHPMGQDRWSSDLPLTCTCSSCCSTWITCPRCCLVIFNVDSAYGNEWEIKVCHCRLVLPGVR